MNFLKGVMLRNYHLIDQTTRKKSSNLWWEGGAANFKFKSFLEISPRTA